MRHSTDTDNKAHHDEVELVENISTINTNKITNAALPAYIASLTPENKEAAENALRKKIDIRLMPMVVLIYIMNYLDRNNIAAARLAGLEEDLNLHGNQFQGWKVPSNLLLNKLGKPSLYLPACMVVWGGISGATAGCETYGGLLACRFVLGFVEAAYFPGCLYYLSAWYTRKELVKRTALLYSGSLLSGAFSGLIAAGITSGLDGAKGLSAWRWLFIVEGSITVFIALFAFFILPDLPRTTNWLSDDEKELAAWRLEEDIGQDDWVDSKQQTFLHGAKLAAKSKGLVTAGHDLWIHFSWYRHYPISRGLGKSNITTLLLTTPPYLIAVIAILCNAWHADKTGERYLHVAIPPVIAFISFIIAAATIEFAPRYL
ncbi:MFS transporter protein [Rutstroemia sp. NJR-2017a BBW]|nr:MFS transporter protein [Rutstroemia sp. NJR-2017a BBW]